MNIVRMLFVSAIILIGLSGPAYPASSAEEILASVVKIRSAIPGDAESAKTLGTERVGSGVVIDSEGSILTVGYLVRDAESIEVIVRDGEPVRATLVGYDYSTGFAIVKAEEKLAVKPMALAKSSAVKLGDSILVAGHGGEETVQVSRVISRQEFAGYWEYLLDDAIYTLPAYVNFSGAALINPDGKLVGIGSLFSQVLLPGLGLIGCNISIPIDLLGPILDDLKNKGRPGNASRPWLGINAEESHGRIFITKVTAGKGGNEAGGSDPHGKWKGGGRPFRFLP